VDVVVDIFDPSHPPNCFFRQITLVVPLDLAFEFDPSVLDRDSYFLPGKREVIFYLFDSIACDFGIWPAVNYG
jgi:hypothetical protein